MRKDKNYHLFKVYTPSLSEDDRLQKYTNAYDWLHLIEEMECPCCKAKEVCVVKGDKVYGSGYEHLDLYQCDTCLALVGMHTDEENKKAPKGLLADSETRQMRKRCHDIFDPMWKKEHRTRSEAYNYLSAVMGLPKSMAHFACFDYATCQKFINLMATRQEWDLDYKELLENPKPPKGDTYSGWDKVASKLKDTEEKRKYAEKMERRKKRW